MSRSCAHLLEDQQQRFLPPIRAVRELWCQGYSEPGAGSDLASVATRAALDGADWVINGQKTWTSLAHLADWCFVLARTEAGSRRGTGLSYLLVPMDQPGITVRPIRQMTGTAEFNEVFFDDARTAAVNVVGAPGDGWRIAKATLAIERGAAMLGQQVGFRRDFEDLAEAARRSGASSNPLIRDRLARAWIGLRIIREYESLAEGVGFRPGVVLSSSLAAVSLLDEEKPTLLARVSGSALTTVIVRNGVLCGYRCTELPALAAAGDADGCLLDTAVKDGRGLLDWLDEPALVAIRADCRARRLLCGLAGSLTALDLPRIRALQPDIVGFRGAACVGDRVSGRVSRERVAALASALRDPAAAGVALGRAT